VAKGAAADVFVYGKHGSTFGGNPLATAAGLATLNAIQEEKLLENAQAMGDLITAGFKAELANTKGIVNIRHAGLMIGIELDRPCAELVKTALAAKLLINVTADSVIRLLPPLVINAEESQALVTRLSVLIKAFLQNK
jgi:acetylornithine/N-succinyldiaminopimelate aminotransferase